jgi:hypothetical protein
MWKLRNWEGWCLIAPNHSNWWSEVLFITCNKLTPRYENGGFDMVGSKWGWRATREWEMLVAAFLINLDTIRSLKVELHVRGSELRKNLCCIMLWWLTLRERRVLFPDFVFQEVEKWMRKWFGLLDSCGLYSMCGSHFSPFLALA